MSQVVVTAASAGQCRRMALGDVILEAVVAAIQDGDQGQDAIVRSATRVLTRLRPAIWIISVMTRDPNVLLTFGLDEEDPLIAAYRQAPLNAFRQATASIVSSLIDSGEPLFLPHVAPGDFLEEYLGQTPSLPAHMTQVGVLAVPLRTQIATIGAIAMFEPLACTPPTQADIGWLQVVAERIAFALEARQLLEDASTRLARLSSVHSVALALRSEHEVGITLKIILDRISAGLAIDACHLLLVDDLEHALIPAARVGFVATTEQAYRLPLDDPLLSLGTSRPGMSDLETMDAAITLRRRTLLAREGFRSYGAFPIASHGKQLGFLELFDRGSINADREWLAFLELMAGLTAIGVEAASLRRSAHPGGAPELSPVDMSILVLIVEGLTNREIGARLHMSPDSVKFHVRHILDRTGAANRTDLTRLAVQRGWV